MKKLLLSSIIMFGVCGFVSAQSATDSKFSKAQAQTASSAAAATPQKSATAAQAKVAVVGDKVTDPTLPADVDKAKAAPAATVAPIPVTAVNEAGVVEVVNPDIAKKRDMQKAAASKAANEKKAAKAN
jgi:hypothetical protein